MKDPRDLDAAYRLTFAGSSVYANTGVLFPTINDYADIYLVDTGIGGFDNAAILDYSRTQYSFGVRGSC